METPVPIPPPAASERVLRLKKVLREVHAARAKGKNIPDEAVIKAYPDLMPELQRELRRLVERAKPPSSVAPETRATGQTRQEKLSAKGDAFTPMTLSVTGYRVLREISRGGQAVVFEAVQESTGRRVALKVMREGPLASASERARFDREVQILAALDHPYIARVTDRGVTGDGSFFLAMDYVTGESLDAWMLKHHPAGIGQDRAALESCLRLFLRICDAVSAAHLRGIVHRDLKPSNIRIDDHGEPRVLDFGLAKSGGPSSTGDAPVTVTGQFLGSLPWASPEQAEGIGSRIDIRSDVYSLGVILYQLLTGQFPYEVTGTMPAVLNNIVSKVPDPPSQTLNKSDPGSPADAPHRRLLRRRGLSPALDSIVLKALAKRREDRYQSAGDLARDLANYLAGLPTVASGYAKSRWLWPGIIGAAASVAIVVIAVVLLNRPRAAEPVAVAVEVPAVVPPMANTANAADAPQAPSVPPAGNRGNPGGDAGQPRGDGGQSRGIRGQQPGIRGPMLDNMNFPPGGGPDGGPNGGRDGGPDGAPLPPDAQQPPMPPDEVLQSIRVTNPVFAAGTHKAGDKLRVDFTVENQFPPNPDGPPDPNRPRPTIGHVVLLLQPAKAGTAIPTLGAADSAGRYKLPDSPAVSASVYAPGQSAPVTATIDTAQFPSGNYHLTMQLILDGQTTALTTAAGDFAIQ